MLFLPQKLLSPLVLLSQTDEDLSVHQVLADNDAYHALLQTGGLIVTGPTGTNVNDLSVLLIRR